MVSHTPAPDQSVSEQSVATENDNAIKTLPEKPGDKKRSNGKIIVFVALGVVLVLATILIILLPGIRCGIYTSKGDRLMEEQKYEEAIVEYDNALKIKPNDEKARKQLGTAYVSWTRNLADSHDYDTALSLLDEGYGKLEMNELLDARASMFIEYMDYELSEGNENLDGMSYEEADAAYDKLLELDPGNEDAYLGKVEIRIRTCQFEEALEIAEKAYEIVGGDKLKKKIDMLESGAIFASNGWVMRRTGYDSSGNITYIHDLTYNIQGNTDTVTWKDPSGNVLDFIDLEYNEKGWLLVGYWYNSDSGKILKIERTYDGYDYEQVKYSSSNGDVDQYFKGTVNEDGNVLEYTEYTKDWVFESRKEYEYNDDGLWIKSTDYNADGTVARYHTMEYDERGNRTKYSIYDSNGNITDYRIYEYDEDGFLLKETEYEADGTVKRVVQAN